MANTSAGEIIDWSPKGDPLDKNNNLDLPILLNSTYDSMSYKVHGILQTRILEWVAVPFSRASS